MSLGEKIKIARTLRGLTQKELGFLVGLSDDRIGHYEINRRTPKEAVLQKIADSTGFPIDFFKNHAIESPIDVMHTIFELKQKYGLTIKKSKDVSGEQVYEMTIENNELSNRVNEWLDAIEKITYGKSNKTIEDIEKECLKWEAKYPLSLADDWKDKLKNARKNECAKNIKD